nr:glycosyltransferase [uncultured Blautia sp.]
MSVICLFTNEYPYGSAEPYLETEIDYYKQFEKVIIFSLQLRKKNENVIRKVPNNCVVVPVRFANKARYILNVFSVLLDGNFYREIKNLKDTKRLNCTTLMTLLIYLSRSHYEAKIVEKYLKNNKIENALFYSYRFEYQPYVALTIKRKQKISGKFISRAHRYDLYENQSKCGYIPCRNEILENIDYVFPCSEDGTNYLKMMYPQYEKKIKTKFLGTKDYGVEEWKEQKVFRIVSCSNIVKVKRLHLIIDALKNISSEIEWVHFGDGILLEDIKKRAQELPKNIQVDFRGNVSNTEILNTYQNESFDLFINVSSSEGIPVSIMEAMSFGIPCLATDAGGTGELVENEKGGVLIPVSSTAEQIKDEVVKIIKMDKKSYKTMRERSRQQWMKKFSANVNYVQMKEILKELMR